MRLTIIASLLLLTGISPDSVVAQTKIEPAKALEHVGRNVRPTEAGAEVYDACKSVFETLANLEMKISDMKGLRRGRLNMCVITTAKYLAPEMLGEFSRDYPDINLSLKIRKLSFTKFLYQLPTKVGKKKTGLTHLVS